MSEDNQQSQYDLKRRKVDFGVFIWTISILSGIMLAVSTYLFSEVTTLRTEVVSTVKEMSAKLEAEKEKNLQWREVLIEVRGELRSLREQLERGPRR
jgi:hypothetical protein